MGIVKHITIATFIAAGTACAFADVNDDLNIGTAGGNFYAGDYHFSFCLTESDGSLTNGNLLAVYWGQYSSDNYYANGYLLASTTGGYTLTVGRGAISNISNATSGISSTSTITFGSDTNSPDSAQFKDSSDNAITLVANTTYTIYVTNSNGMHTASLYSGLYTDTSVPTSATALGSPVAYKSNMNGGGANTQITSYINANYAIPEPSAFGLLAGLGALALAGTRRRRCK